MINSNGYHKPNFVSPRELLIIFSILVLGILTLFSLEFGPNPIFEDDAFFYWVSALRTIEHGFPTFDGYEPTNGFHWLWYFTLTCSALFAQLSGVSTLTSNAIFLLLPSLVLWTIVFRNMHSSLIFLALVSALFIGFTMETALAGLLLGIGLLKILKNKSPLIWLTLAMLARVDLILAIGVILPLLAKRHLVLLLSGAIFSVLVSMTVNYLLVGEFFSVSSELKAGSAINSASGYLSNLWSNVSSYGNLYRYLIVLVLNIVLIILHIKYSKGTKNVVFFAVVFAANTFLIAHSLVSSMRDWYFAPTIIALLLLTSSYIAPISEKVRAKLVLLLNCTAFMGVALLLAYTVMFYPSWVSGKEFYKEACDVLDGERVFVYDGSGKLAWNLYDCAEVTNGDGLVNSHKYMREILKHGRFIEYLEENRIRFYITNNKGSPFNCPVGNVCFDDSRVKLRARSEGGSILTSYQLVEILGVPP